MATTSPAVTQTTTAFNKLSQYFSDLSSYLTNGVTYPSASDYIGNLEYSELFNISSLNQKGSSNYANGTAIETIHHIIAVQRELGMANTTKFQHYSNGGSDGTDESDYYASLSSQFGYVISGLGSAATNGS
ncbi:MAG TPA: hypothetical protein VN922_25295 [Bacteroidia bacterium]|nr:hypothetical protein [Bacteroidia bacterium]